MNLTYSVPQQDYINFCLFSMRSSSPARRSYFITWLLSPALGIFLSWLKKYADGSGDLLEIFASGAQKYVDWASEYYEISIPLDAVWTIYDGVPLSKETVLSLNPAIRHWDQLEEYLKK